MYCIEGVVGGAEIISQKFKGSHVVTRYHQCYLVWLQISCRGIGCRMYVNLKSPIMGSGVKWEIWV